MPVFRQANHSGDPCLAGRPSITLMAMRISPELCHATCVAPGIAFPRLREMANIESDASYGSLCAITYTPSNYPLEVSMKKASNSWASVLNGNLPVKVCALLIVLYVGYVVVSMTAVGKKMAQKSECENATLVASTNQFGRKAEEQRRLDAEADLACNPAAQASQAASSPKQ